MLAVSDYVVTCMHALYKFLNLAFFRSYGVNFWYTIVPIAIGLEGMPYLKMKGIESNWLMCRAKLRGNHMDRLTLIVAQ